MTDGVRRLTHDEAEMLISARMDEQLDRADSRALLVHLQSCESCRAFAVQSEILGRELEALPMLAPSAIVDRRIRESIQARGKRWSLASLLPAAGGSSGLRAAAAALAVLALVSVYLLIRMAGSHNSGGPSIDAPNGGVAQQIDRTVTTGLGAVQSAAGPTETPRVISPPSRTAENGQASASGQTGPVSTEPAGQGDVQPTATLDAAYVYTIDKTRTPRSGARSATSTPVPTEIRATEPSDDVVVAALGDPGTPEGAATETMTAEPAASDPPATPAELAISNAPETPNDGSDETPEAPETTPEPTLTPTPIELSVAAEEASQEAGTQPESEQPASDATQETTPESDRPSRTPVEVTPTASPAGRPESSNPASPVATDAPFAQPTIAPITANPVAPASAGEDSSNDHQGAPHDAPGDTGAGESPRIQPSNGSDANQPDATGDGSGGSPQIVSVDGTAMPDDAVAIGGADSTGGESGVGGATQNDTPAAIPTVDRSVEPSGLDLSSTVATLPAGTSSPLGRLEFSPGADLYAVTAPDGQLAVANLDGELIVALGAGDLPVWSGTAMMFSAPGESGQVVGIWNSGSGELNYVPSSEEEPSNDLPIGGDGESFYFLRTFPDRPGAMEIHRATIDGSDEGIVWSSESSELSGARPAWSQNGILLPAGSVWLLIDTDGTETELGENPYGFVGAPVISPGGGLLAYSAGDQVIVAWTEDPGTAVATAPFGGATGGYAFAVSGEEVVVSDGTALHVVSYEGNDLGTLSGNQPIGAVYWLSDTIYYLQIGEDAALRATSLETIQAGDE